MFKLNCRRFDDKIALITGGGQGIGKAIASRLGREGASLMIVDINGEKLSQTEKEFRNQMMIVRTFVGDVSEYETADYVASKTVDELGKIDVLVNNVGGGILRLFLDHDKDSINTTIRRNLISTISSCRAVIPHMIKRKWGRIVNIGADSVNNGLWLHAVYNAAKGGVHALTLGLAGELAPYGITVNCVAPTGTETEIIRQWKLNPSSAPPEMAVLNQHVREAIPFHRQATVQEVAGTVAFLASDDASFITGQVISVNGGIHLVGTEWGEELRK